jgi:hypothetical protein
VLLHDSCKTRKIHHARKLPAQATTAPNATAHPLNGLRLRYPVGLVCTICLTILATKPESYARSALTEAARLTYICAECRADQIEATRLADARRANLAHARATRWTNQDGDAPRNGNSLGLLDAPGCDHPLADPHQQREFDTGFRNARTREGARRGGRPRRYTSAAEGARLRQRAYRARQRLRRQTKPEPTLES